MNSKFLSRIARHLLSLRCLALLPALVTCTSVLADLQYVDLGLPSGLLWADRNIGASSPQDPGYYYAWGETDPKDLYSWENYKFGNGDKNSLTKYGWNSSMGVVDGIHVLEAEDDVATVMFGKDYHIPTAEECQELLDNTDQQPMSIENTAGWLFTSKQNGKSIFFPNGGHRSNFGTDDYYKDQVYCWASTNYDCWGSNAQLLNADIRAYVSSIARCVGLNIRPVSTADSVVYVEPVDSISLSVEGLDFGEVSLGRTKTKSFTIQNLGMVGLTIKVKMGDNSEFTSDWLAGEIQPGEIQTVNINWTPQVVRRYVGDAISVGTEELLSKENGITINLSGSCIKPGSSLEGRTHLMVWQKDGAKVAFVLNDNPNVKMSEGKLYVSSTTMSAEYNQADVAKLTYEDLGIGSIHEVTNDGDSTELPYQYTPEALIFLPSNIDMQVRIITLGGTVKNEFIVDAGTTVSIPLNTFSTGVYLVRVNNATYKIIIP